MIRNHIQIIGLFVDNSERNLPGEWPKIEKQNFSNTIRCHMHMLLPYLVHIFMFSLTIINGSYSSPLVGYSTLFTSTYHRSRFKGMRFNSPHYLPIRSHYLFTVLRPVFLMRAIRRQSWETYSPCMAYPEW